MRAARVLFQRRDERLAQRFLRSAGPVPDRDPVFLGAGRGGHRGQQGDGSDTAAHETQVQHPKSSRLILWRPAPP